ncbi:MAG: GTP-binding protein [Pseudomonadales bacterium]|nr:GTP-binding protein [Candidatus Woesebacteria bacterium]MCB9801685.1 GTP-binding protein [Pseudomonadales bacterium]
MQSIPTTLFTGFLGSGKTTIITHLIDELQARGEQTIYIKNEVGETDIDAQVLKEQGVQTTELLNGCICCTLVGPFTATIDELAYRYTPSRIIIEASGAADPAALALMISSHPLLTRDGVISVIDVVNFEGYQDLSITAQEQTKFTDVLVFNKVEMVDDERKRQVVSYVRELNEHSPIIEAVGGKAPLAVIVGASRQELETLLRTAESAVHNHLETDHFSASTITLEGLFDQEKLLEVLESVPPELFRAKGIVRTQAGRVLCNAVAGRVTLELLDNSQDVGNTLVFIGHNAKMFAGQLSNKLQSALV